MVVKAFVGNEGFTRDCTNIRCRLAASFYHVVIKNFVVNEGYTRDLLLFVLTEYFNDHVIERRCQTAAYVSTVTCKSLVTNECI
jgi:hypothetical protein